MSKPSFVYVIYIASTPEKVFAALTDTDMSRRYWDGNQVESDWKVGSPFKLKRAGRDVVVGAVLEVDAPHRLVYSFHSQHDGLDREPPSRVTFTIERQKDQVRLIVTHDGFEPGSKALDAISRGWPLVLSSLKSFLEAGKVLHAPWYSEETRAAEGAAS